MTRRPVEEVLLHRNYSLAADWREFYSEHKCPKVPNDWNWGCPDWEDPGKYPKDINDWPEWRWKWEFLRRCPDYRYQWFDFTRFLEHMEADERSHHSTKQFEMLNEQGKSALLAMSEEIKKFEVGEWEQAACQKWRMRTFTDPSEGRLSISPFLQQPLIWSNPAGGRKRDPELWKSQFRGTGYQDWLKFLKRLNVDETSDAVEAAPGSLEEAFGLIRLMAHQRVEETNSESELYEDVALALFDLGRPLEPQWEALRSQLQPIQKHVIHPPRAERHGGEDRKLWPRHLRLIDARDQGAKLADIFLQLVDDGWKKENSRSQPKSVASQWNKQAREVMRKAAVFL